MNRRPCWCPKQILWEVNSFLMQTLSFVPINLHRYWPREWKHSVLCTLNMTLNSWTVVTLNSQAWLSFFTVKYVHIRDFKHASRAVFACCERWSPLASKSSEGKQMIPTFDLSNDSRVRFGKNPWNFVDLKPCFKMRI